jgi:hypothetical protein
MSRRNKHKDAERLVIHGMNKTEWRLRNYLHLNDIYKGNNDMATIIINSFFNERGGDNNADWKDKVAYCDTHFGKFAQYAHTWKRTGYDISKVDESDVLGTMIADDEGNYPVNK